MLAQAVSLSGIRRNKPGNVEEFERQLLDICEEIGLISGCSGVFTCSLAVWLDRKIKETGGSLTDLSVGEFLCLIREYTEYYNKRGQS